MKTQNYVHCTNLFIFNPPLASLFKLSEMDNTEQLEDRRRQLWAQWQLYNCLSNTDGYNLY